jgi:hypothetical protein
MVNGVPYNVQQKIKRVLLQLTLVLSVFMFSGFAAETSARGPQSTELVARVDVHTKRNVSYQQKVISFYDRHFECFFQPDFINLILQHQQLTHVRLKQNEENILQHKTLVHLISVRSLPAPAEDYFSFLHG